MLLMILALARGVVVHYQDFIHFDAFTAHAEGDGGGGAGGGGDGAGGAGGGGDGAGGAGGSTVGVGGGELPPPPQSVAVSGACGDTSIASGVNTCSAGTLGENHLQTGGIYDWYCMGINGGSPSGLCRYTPPPILGCTNSTATNFNPSATVDDGSCTYPPHTLAPTCILTVNPSAIQNGGSSTLHWTTSNVTSFSIDHSIGSVTPVAIGSKGITPVVTTTYTGTATGAGGSVTCAATVTVTTVPPPPTAPTCTLTANPTAVNSGDHSVLSWTTTHSDTFTIDHSIGVVTPAIGGSATTTAITANTTFTGTVVSPTGQVATCTAAVTVHTGGGGGGGPSCTLTILPASYVTGGSATLTWGGSEIQSVFIDNGIGTTTNVSGSMSISPSTVQSYTYTGTFKATNGQTVTCSAPLTVTGGGGGGGGGCSGNCGGGGGGGGGGSPEPKITLAALLHVNSQPLAYLYLSQIPQTGLDLGPIGTIVYWLVLIGFACTLAYLMLFSIVPSVGRSLRNFGSRVSLSLNAQELAPAGVPHTMSSVIREPHIVVSDTIPEAPRGYSSYDGFKSFAQGGALSIEDLVKGLSREHVERTAEQGVSPTVSAPRVEPIYEHVEPIRENVEPTMTDAIAQKEGTPILVRGFVMALLEGDRAAVFAGLRQHVRGSGMPEQLITTAVCLLDDVYRARIDGSACDPDIARMAARLNTGTLENLIASLTTAIDSSYSTGVTGAKLALTRALAVLGA